MLCVYVNSMTCKFRRTLGVIEPLSFRPNYHSSHILSSVRYLSCFLIVLFCSISIENIPNLSVDLTVAIIIVFKFSWIFFFKNNKYWYRVNDFKEKMFFWWNGKKLKKKKIKSFFIFLNNSCTYNQCTIKKASNFRWII